MSRVLSEAASTHGTTILVVFLDKGLILTSDTRVTDDTVVRGFKSIIYYSNEYHKIVSLSDHVVVAFAGRVVLWESALSFAESLVNQDPSIDAFTVAVEVKQHFERVDVKCDELDMIFTSSTGDSVYHVCVDPKRKAYPTLRQLQREKSGGIYAFGTGKRLALPYVKQRSYCTLEDALPTIQLAMLHAALGDDYTGGSIRMFLARPVDFRPLPSEKMINLYHNNFDQVEDFGKCMLVVVPKFEKEEDHVLIKVLGNHLISLGSQWQRKCHTYWHVG